MEQTRITDSAAAIGARVAAKRKEKGWDQDQLAKAVRRLNPSLGTKPSTICSIEKGGSKNPTIAAEIAAALDVSALWLKTGIGPEKVTASEAEDVQCLLTAVLGSYDFLGCNEHESAALLELVQAVCEARKGSASPLDRNQARLKIADLAARKFLRSKRS